MMLTLIPRVSSVMLLIAAAALGQMTLHTVIPSTFKAGSPSTFITTCGKGMPGGSFAQGCKIEWIGAGGTVTFLANTTYLYTISSEYQIASAPVPAALLANPGVFGVRWACLFTGAPYSPIFPVTVLPSLPGPVVGSVTPSTVGLGVGGVPITVYGSGFGPSSQVFFDNTPATTTFISSSALSGMLTSACPGAGRTGAIAVSVFDPTQSTPASNATHLQVNSMGQNLGLLTMSPPNPSPGAPITCTIGGIRTNTYVYLVMSPTPTVSIFPWPTYIEQQVLGLNLSSTSIIIDGINQGVVSVPMPLTGGGGAGFSFPAMLPSPPVGRTISFQAAFLDPTSLLGYRLTNTLHGVSF